MDNNKQEVKKDLLKVIPTNTGDTKAEKPEPPAKMRQIVIETDGNNIVLEKAEVSGNIELIAILQTVIKYISSQTQK